MSEQQPGPGQNAAPPVPIPPRPAPDQRGSLWAGIGIAWAVMIGGEVAVLPTNAMLWPLPPVTVVVWAVVLLVRGRTRTGGGMLLGLASVIAVLLLLVAACFGLLYSGGSGFHG
jgi:hypothetical protein